MRGPDQLDPAPGSDELPLERALYPAASRRIDCIRIPCMHAAL